VGDFPKLGQQQKNRRIDLPSGLLLLFPYYCRHVFEVSPVAVRRFEDHIPECVDLRADERTEPLCPKTRSMNSSRMGLRSLEQEDHTIQRCYPYLAAKAVGNLLD